MSLSLTELTAAEVTGFNRKAVEDHRARHPGSKQVHQLVRSADLQGCLGGIFYQASGVKGGYVHLPIENMAGLLLYRIAQGQFFMDANKRTALLSCAFFLFNNGCGLRIDRGRVNDLLWNFSPDTDGVGDPKPKYTETDAAQYIYDNIFVRS